MNDNRRRGKTIEPRSLPQHFDYGEAESRWDRVWSERGIYRYRPEASREETFAVDTPPPTVSGSLHIGHVFSYTQTDIIARYQRMRGKNIFYPMGWDDNGLPTERRVQNYFHVTCDPALPYQPDLRLEEAAADRSRQPPHPVSRQNFIELCQLLTREDEKAFTGLWRRIGLSVDWSREYTTIGDHARRIAQLSFLDLQAKGHIYNREAPTLWDIDFHTAVAQAELEDREEEGAFYRIEFGVEGEERVFTVATTRPELLAACVGVAAHPDDPRYRGLFGRRAVTPLFHLAVPIFPSPKADPQKGTGILMVCTFGDSSDVEWWRERNLPLRQIIGPDGRLLPADFRGASRRPGLAEEAYREIQGRSVREARKRTAELLRRPALSVSGERPALTAEPEPVRHPVKYYEKGKNPIEFLSTRQWFVRLLDKKEMLLEKGRQVSWHPPHMGLRYRNWTENLQFDWCISRQRYFGVPFPVWYPLDEAGRPDHGRPIVAPPDRLPVDPMIHPPPGYREELRGRPGGFTGEPDVFDTWFTSSLTPQIGSGWVLDPQSHRRLFPMDVRPQAHEIIRTWAFYTIVKAALHEDTVPWAHALISGWILDPDRRKMSKSKGGAVTPMQFLERYSADGVRYWAAGARLGVDTAFDETAFKVGRRLVTKLYNAARFVLAQEAPVRPISREIDRAFVGKLRRLIGQVSPSMEAFDYAGALEQTEAFFWRSFTDTYIELAKNRARAGSPAAGRGSAVAALRLGLQVLVRLFAPVLPYITEEIWSWAFAEGTGRESVHLAPWPDAGELDAVERPSFEESFDLAASALGRIHREKTLAQRSVSAAIEELVLEGSPADLPALRLVQDDLAAAARVARLTLREKPGAERGQIEIGGVLFSPGP